MPESEFDQELIRRVALMNLGGSKYQSKSPNRAEIEKLLREAKKQKLAEHLDF